MAIVALMLPIPDIRGGRIHPMQVIFSAISVGVLIYAWARSQRRISLTIATILLVMVLARMGWIFMDGPGL